MLKINCDRCQNELESPGALIFSPPAEMSEASVVKYHLCVSCWKALREDIWYKHPSLAIDGVELVSSFKAVIPLKGDDAQHGIYKGSLVESSQNPSV